MKDAANASKPVKVMDWMTLSGYRLPPGTHAGAVAAAVAANASAAAAAAASTANAAAVGGAATIKPELNRSSSAMSDHGNAGGSAQPPETPSPELWSGGGAIGPAGTANKGF